MERESEENERKTNSEETSWAEKKKKRYIQIRDLSNQIVKNIKHLN